MLDTSTYNALMLAYARDSAICARLILTLSLSLSLSLSHTEGSVSSAESFFSVFFSALDTKH